MKIGEKIFVYVSLFVVGIGVIWSFGALMNDYYETLSEHLAYETKFGHPLPWVESIKGTDF